MPVCCPHSLQPTPSTPALLVDALTPPRRLSSRKNPIVQEYVLPDFSNNRIGYIRSGPGAVPRAASPDTTGQDQDGLASPNAPQPSSSGTDDPVLYMSNERFTVPEVLFHPADVGEFNASSY